MGKVLQFKPKLTTEPVTFKDFAFKVRDGDQDGAARLLVQLFNCSIETASKCTAHFQSFMMSQGPGGIQKTMSIREEILGGNTNGALALLMECFGLQVQDAIPTLNFIQKNLQK